MKVRRIPTPTLDAVTTLLRDAVPAMTPELLVAALEAYEPGAGPSAPEIPPGQLLTPNEAAARLHVCRATIFRLLATGELPRVRFGRRVTRIPEDAVTGLAARGGLNGSST